MAKVMGKRARDYVLRAFSRRCARGRGNQWCAGTVADAAGSSSATP
jgi:hypothetical protein